MDQENFERRPIGGCEMKKDVVLILVAIFVVFSFCACSNRIKEPAEGKPSVHEKLEKNYINTAKEFTKQVRFWLLIHLRTALGIRGLQSSDAAGFSEGDFKELADGFLDKGRAFARNIGLDFLYRGFCLYSPFSLLL